MMNNIILGVFMPGVVSITASIVATFVAILSFLFFGRGSRISLVTMVAVGFFLFVAAWSNGHGYLCAIVALLSIAIVFGSGSAVAFLALVAGVYGLVKVYGVIPTPAAWVWNGSTFAAILILFFGSQLVRGSEKSLSVIFLVVLSIVSYQVVLSDAYALLAPLAAYGVFFAPISKISAPRTKRVREADRYVRTKTAVKAGEHTAKRGKVARNRANVQNLSSNNAHYVNERYVDSSWHNNYYDPTLDHCYDDFEFNNFDDINY